MPPGYVLRPITSQDLTAVGDSYWRSHRGTEHEMSRDAACVGIRAAWDGEYGGWLPHASLCAVVGDDVVGAVITVDDAPWSDVPTGPFIIGLFVGPAARRRGIASALVQTMQSVLPTRIGLRVDASAAGARSLYASLGFTVTG